MISDFNSFICHSHSKTKNEIHKCSYHPITKEQRKLMTIRPFVFMKIRHIHKPIIFNQNTKDSF